MSRSNYDKPFYVDVGTSIAAVRCQSNDDVLYRFDHVILGKVGIEMAEKMCDRMNAEVEKLIAAKDAEIEKLKFDNLHLKSCQRQSGEVIIEQTNKVEEKDAEIEKLKKENARLRVIVSGATVADDNFREEIGRLREIVKELSECIYGNPCTGCLSYSCSFCKHRRKMNALVTKAREDVK